jgi:S-DNA-T family DNA segregation ATPase FtsK/SpoIIIE
MGGRLGREAAVVVVIDELADLLMVGGAGLQRALTRLLQRGRGAGIHVVAATQKPTAGVLGTLVKANFPVRLVGRVASANDARVASGWSGTGAERLEGRGDFIALAEGRVTRFQAAHVTREEIEGVVGQVRGEMLPALEGRGAEEWEGRRR